ncbi:MAG: MFS transporter [Gammaproteobacteria bacterium]|nr:MFS transporter [Gammaproteobacteria bacterium]
MTITNGPWRRQRRRAGEDRHLEADNAENASAAPRQGMFSSFAIPSFRYQWSADVLSAWAAEMETIILAWYVLVETGSPFLVSLIAALRFGGTLVSPLVGVLADRMSRRTILLALRGIYAVLAGSLMIGGVVGVLPLWYLFTVAALAGLIRPSEMILRQSLIADTVPRHLLVNAMGFSRTTLESARIVGALLGAGLLASFGIGLAYAGVTAFYLVSIAVTRRIDVPPRTEPLVSGAPWPDLIAGFAYMRRTREIMVVMYLAFLANLTAFPVTQGLLPIVAKDVFGFDEIGLGRMVAITGAGALAGSLAIAALLRTSRPERMMFAGLITWHVLIIVFALVESPGAAFVLLALIGVCIGGSMIPMSVVLMSHTEAAYRGRVMGVRMLAVYGLPIGLLASGAMIESIGVAPTLLLLGVAGLGVVSMSALRWRPG